jgi:disulfide bond formation protein DsbB
VSDQAITTFFALVSVAVLGGALAIGVAAVTLAASGGPSWLVGLRAELSRVSLGLASMVAGGATLGSLWYSEVVGYAPCQLCWVQRIFMYSLAVVLLVAAVRNDWSVRPYGLALAVPGAAIAAYHAGLQAWGTGTSTFCTLDAPCTERHVWEFGFVSIPFMAMSAFLLVACLLWWAVPGRRSAPVQVGEAGNDSVEVPT